MPTYVLRFDPSDQWLLHIQLAGLARSGDTPWQERFRDGYLELFSDDKELMRLVWRVSKHWQRARPLVED